MKLNMLSSGWPQHACPVCKWMRSVPGLTARSNPRLSLPFQSSNREKKLAEERGLYDSWGVYFRAMLTTNTYLIININTFSEQFLSPVSYRGLISFISIRKYYLKSIKTVAFNAFHAVVRRAAFWTQEGAESTSRTDERSRAEITQQRHCRCGSWDYYRGRFPLTVRTLLAFLFNIHTSIVSPASTYLVVIAKSHKTAWKCPWRHLQRDIQPLSGPERYSGCFHLPTGCRRFAHPQTGTVKLF